jgi:hypothetical protein
MSCRRCTPVTLLELRSPLPMTTIIVFRSVFKTPQNLQPHIRINPANTTAQLTWRPLIYETVSIRNTSADNSPSSVSSSSQRSRRRKTPYLTGNCMQRRSSRLWSNRGRRRALWLCLRGHEELGSSCWGRLWHGAVTSWSGIVEAGNATCEAFVHN